MSTTLTPAAGSEYRQYKKSVEDVTADYEKQLNNEREKSSREANAVREQAAAERLKAREDADKTVTKSKEALNETVERERAMNKREVERMRSEMYDKFGRYNGQEADTLREQLDAAKIAYETQRKRDKVETLEMESNYQNKLKNAGEQKNAAIEDAVRTYRESIGEQSEYAIAARKENERQARTESQEKYQRLDDTRIAEQDDIRRHTKQSIENLQKGFTTKIKELERSENERGLKSRDAHRTEAEKAIKQQAEAHAREVGDLRENVKDMISADLTTKKVLANKVEEYNRETARDIKQDHERIVNDRDAAIAAERERSARSEAHQHAVKRETLKDQDMYYNDVLRNQTAEYYDREKTLKTGFETAYEQVNKRADMDREQSQQAAERAAQRSGETLEKTLELQANAYREAGRRERENLQTELSQAKKELHTKNTSADPNDISPAAEAAVRNAVTREYEKTFGAERARNEKTIDGIQQSYSNRMADELNEREFAETDRNRLLTSEHHRERTDLLNEIDDSEYRKATALREADEMGGRERDKLIRNYSSMMDQQRKKYEELLQTVRYDASEKAQMTRREHELNMKMTNRAFSARQNELIRDYQKQLADQKQDYETRLADTKNGGDAALRNLDRQNKLQTEEITKGYEGRIAMLEQANKERERATAARYEDQIDRMRRSHAISTKKV